MTLRRGYLDLADGQLHYRFRAGADRAPVLFLHQTASSGRMWEKVMALMDADRTLYAPDTPGFGGSFDCPDVGGMAGYAGWMLEAMDVLGLSQAHVVGHHTGAAIGLEMANRAPGRIASLTMIGPNALTTAERTRFAARLGAPFRPVRSGAYLLKNWEYLRVGGAGADVMLLHAEMIDMMRAWSARPHAYAAVWEQDFDALYARVSCPMLIMAARDDMLFPFLERARDMRPDAQAVVLDEGANFEPDLAADAVAAALTGFLAARP